MQSVLIRNARPEWQNQMQLLMLMKDFTKH